MPIRLYDTRTRKKVDFQPLEPGKVGLYSCGITVYDESHVGHARSAVVFDVVVRYLRAAGLDVCFVRNITDIDDKIIRRAQNEHKSAETIAQTYAASMAADMAALGITTPTHEPAATQHVGEIIALIGRLIERGLAYPAGGDVYFSVPSFSSYGALSGQSVDDLKSGARIEVGELKQSPLDFALWKGVKPGEPSWPSPWGPGRPGWHIECSAMAHTFLGEVFDIHGGGSDLIFPHHENERAQSEGAFGVGSFARYWMHHGMVNFGGEKMSKSLGNIVTIKKVQETHDLESLRLLFLGVHYRSPVSFTLARDEQGRPQYPDLDEAEERLDYFYRTLERLDQLLGDAVPVVGAPILPAAQGTWDRFCAAMDDDFNTATALADFYEGFVLANKLLDDAKAAPKDVRKQTLAQLRVDLRRAGEVLGIFQRPASAFLLARRERLCRRRNIDPAEVEQQIAARTAARAAKDFAAADAVRVALKARNIELMDSPQGTTWRVV